VLRLDVIHGQAVIVGLVNRHTDGAFPYPIREVAHQPHARDLAPLTALILHLQLIIDIQPDDPTIKQLDTELVPALASGYGRGLEPDGICVNVVGIGSLIVSVKSGHLTKQR
jgi:hypothetical protein